MVVSKLSVLFSTLLILLNVAQCMSHIPGGLQEADLDDPYIKQIAKFAESKLRENWGSARKWVTLVKAHRQIVSGSKVYMTLVAKSEDMKEYCDVVVWDRPWLKDTQLLSSNCSAAQSKDNSKEYETMELFNSFIKKHQKKYVDKAEFKKRFHIFKANLKKIKHLQDTEQGTAKYGPTEFADLSKKEFKQYLGLNPNLQKREVAPIQFPDVQLPTEFDWRTKNAVTHVKNQGMCGSCWAFSVTGNIEGQWAINRGELLELSEQELVDCDKSDNGCGGGYMTNAYDAIIELGGLETEADYPYDGMNEQCHIIKKEQVVNIDSFVNITANETKIAQWLFKNGPVSIGLNANAMQFYMGGISHPLKMLCSPDSIDHGVLLVGFGVGKTKFTHKVLPYWIIKNSWGTRWGEKGYYRLFRGGDACGVSQMASSAIINHSL